MCPFSSVSYVVVVLYLITPAGTGTAPLTAVGILGGGTHLLPLYLLVHVLVVLLSWF